MTGAYRKFPKGLTGALPDTTVFITGCGRSGTTLLFQMLSDPENLTQDQILSLNEPRELYLNAAESFDIWSSQAANRGATLTIPPAVGPIIGYLAAGRQVYLEKMPEHILRTGLTEAFPNAKIIYL